METREITDHNMLTDFYRESGLEIGKNWVEEMHPIKSLCLFDGDTLMGCATVSERYGKTILDYIAVKKELRHSGMGKKLFFEIFPGGTMFISAKAVDFFLKIGCVETSEAPYFANECDGCRQKGLTCFPKILKYSEELK